MEASGHRKFGRAICKKFDLPIKYREWARAPDFRFIWKTHKQNKYLHRFTYHGMDNVEDVIGKTIEKKMLPYEDKYSKEVVALVASHTFADLFNAPIVPSYPNNLKFKWVPKHKRKYIKVALDDPKNLDELFEDIISSFRQPEDLTDRMVREYRDLPSRKGWLIRIIEKHYKRYG